MERRLRSDGQRNRRKSKTSSLLNVNGKDNSWRTRRGDRQCQMPICLRPGQELFIQFKYYMALGCIVIFITTFGQEIEIILEEITAIKML